MAAWKHWYRKGGEKLPKQLGEEQPGQPMLVQHTAFIQNNSFMNSSGPTSNSKRCIFSFLLKRKWPSLKVMTWGETNSKQQE